MASVFVCILSVLLVINTANGLRCYKCNSKDSTQCKWGFTSFTFDTEECATAGGLIDRLIAPKCYKITAQSKDGKDYIARGCLPPANFGCSAMAQAVGWIASSTSNDGESLQNLSCESCETDKCNSANNLVTFTYIGLILSAIAFFL